VIKKSRKHRISLPEASLAEVLQVFDLRHASQKAPQKRSDNCLLKSREDDNAFGELIVVERGEESLRNGGEQRHGK